MAIKLELELCELQKLERLAWDESMRLHRMQIENSESSATRETLKNESVKFTMLQMRLENIIAAQLRRDGEDTQITTDEHWHRYATDH